jgi:transcriptional regulator with XRE-family HTH domain
MAGAGNALSAFGQRLRMFRKGRGWTQEDLARRTNRHWTYIGGLERGERNPTLIVICELAAALAIQPGELLAEPHPICETFNASVSDILDAIGKGFRAQIDVKGKLAELYMNRRLDALRASGAIEDLVWLDVDGRPDFLVRHRGREMNVECKNIRNETYANPPSYKVELQRTRNSMDGTPTRGYKAEDFDVLGVSLFNQTRRWDYLYVATRHLERRSTMPDLLKVMQRVPMEPNDVWTPDPLQAFDDALGM